MNKFTKLLPVVLMSCCGFLLIGKAHAALNNTPTPPRSMLSHLDGIALASNGARWGCVFKTHVTRWDQGRAYRHPARIVRVGFTRAEAINRGYQVCREMRLSCKLQHCQLNTGFDKRHYWCYLGPFSAADIDESRAEKQVQTLCKIRYGASRCDDLKLKCVER